MKTSSKDSSTVGSDATNPLLNPVNSKEQQSFLARPHIFFQLKYIPVHFLSPVELKAKHMDRQTPLPDDEKNGSLSNSGHFILHISFFGQYTGGITLLHYPACKPGSLITAVPAQASGSVNLQGGD